jgi:hypothetical protein
MLFFSGVHGTKTDFTSRGMQKLVCAIIMYVAVMALVVSLKPTCMYDSKTKRFRAFGTYSDATLFPMWLCASVVAILSYLSASALVPWLPFHPTTATTTTTAAMHHPMEATAYSPFAAAGESSAAVTAATDSSYAATTTAAIPPSPMRRATFGGDMSFAQQQQQQHHVPHEHCSHAPHHPSYHQQQQQQPQPQQHQLPTFYPHASSYTHHSRPNHLSHHANVRKSVHDSRVWKKAMT